MPPRRPDTCWRGSTCFCPSDIYLALTDVAASAIGLPAYVADFVEHEEDDGAGGTLLLHAKDMGPVWERRRSEGTVDLGADGILFSMERTLPVSTEVAWDYLTRLDTRAVVFGSMSDEVEALTDQASIREVILFPHLRPEGSSE